MIFEEFECRELRKLKIGSYDHGRELKTPFIQIENRKPQRKIGLSTFLDGIFSIILDKSRGHQLRMPIIWSWEHGREAKTRLILIQNRKP